MKSKSYVMEMHLQMRRAEDAYFVQTSISDWLLVVNISLKII